MRVIEHEARFQLYFSRQKGGIKPGPVSFHFRLYGICRLGVYRIRQAHGSEDITDSHTVISHHTRMQRIRHKRTNKREYPNPMSLTGFGIRMMLGQLVPRFQHDTRPWFAAVMVQSRITKKSPVGHLNAGLSHTRRIPTPFMKTTQHMAEVLKMGIITRHIHTISFDPCLEAGYYSNSESTKGTKNYINIPILKDLRNHLLHPISYTQVIIRSCIQIQLADYIHVSIPRT